MEAAPFLTAVSLRRDVQLDRGAFPTSLPFLPDLDLRFTSNITFFVGENGSGKSTLLEALAAYCGLPVCGGGKNELSGFRAPQIESELAPYLRVGFRRRPRDGYFFRAEFQAHFASLLEERRNDPDFRGDPFARYGGRSLHARSHGEAFLAMFASWMRPGIILMDEPEAALSPQRQLSLLVHMATLAKDREVQFIAATHSPILLTFPGATLISFDAGSLETIRLEDTPHYQITRGLLENPQRYWDRLLSSETEPEVPELPQEPGTTRDPAAEPGSG